MITLGRMKGPLLSFFMRNACTDGLPCVIHSGVHLLWAKLNKCLNVIALDNKIPSLFWSLFFYQWFDDLHLGPLYLWGPVALCWHTFALNYFMISLWLVVMLAEGSGMTGSDVIHPHEKQCCTEFVKICLSFTYCEVVKGPEWLTVYFNRGVFKCRTLCRLYYRFSISSVSHTAKECWNNTPLTTHNDCFHLSL